MVTISAPQKTLNYQSIAGSLAVGICEAIAQNPAGVIAQVVEIFKGATASTSTSPDEQAWIWLNLTTLRCMSDFLSDPWLRSDLNPNELSAVIAPYLKMVLEESLGQEIRPETFYSPASLEVVGKLRSSITDICSATSPDHGREPSYLLRRFDEALTEHSALVLSEYPVQFSNLIESVFGTAGEPNRRFMSWLRHEAWIRSLFTSSPVFSPDDQLKIPLSHTYQNLRCYSVIDELIGEGEEVTKRRNVTLGSLHKECHDWLESEVSANIKVIAGGPGSGKSSFSKAFSKEVLQKSRFRVVYVQLQHMTLTNDLWSDIERYLKRRDVLDIKGSPGLSGNPFQWCADESRELLLVFDGLDELTHKDEESKKLSRQFIFLVKNLLIERNAGGMFVKALILGRNAACSDAIAEADLPSETLLNVAPLCPVDIEVLSVDRFNATFFDPENVAADDQRPDYWNRWRRACRQKEASVPQALTSESGNQLTHEPLLLHLLIVSGYLEESDDVRKLDSSEIFGSLFEKIHARNKGKNLISAKGLESEDFFILLESLGLTAWHGSGRTGTDDHFRKVRKAFAGREKKFQSLGAAEMDNVAMQIHTRRDFGQNESFEFIHKSFGEYLAGRALLTAGLKIARKLMDEDQPEDVAPLWLTIVGSGNMTNQVLGFLRSEAEKRFDTLAADIKEISCALVALLEWILYHGAPTHWLQDTTSFTEMKILNGNATIALIAVINAVNRCVLRRDEELNSEVRDLWQRNDLSLVLSDTAALERFPAQKLLDGYNLREMHFSRVNFEYASLSKADFSRTRFHTCSFIGADLSNCSLEEVEASGCNFVSAMLTDSNFRGSKFLLCNMRGIDANGTDFDDAEFEYVAFGGEAKTVESELSSALNLTDVQLSLTFGGSRTSLPEGLDQPDHWEVLEHDAEEI